MAENLVQLQWAPPPIEQWDLTRNCYSFARFVSTIVRRSEKGKVDMCGIDVYALHEYVASSLPLTWPESDANFTSTHTALWYLSVCYSSSHLEGTRASQCGDNPPCQAAFDFHIEILSMISDAWHGEGACLEELRSCLDIKGNADMAGIGVMVSFCIEVFLIVAFLTAYAVAHLRRNRAPPNRRERVLDAFKAVLPTFYWTSVLLSLGITVASLKASVEALDSGQPDQLARWKKGESSYSPYDTQLAAMASLLSALPPFMAGIMLCQSSRRRRPLNTMILLGLVILFTVLIIFSTWGHYSHWVIPSPMGQLVNLSLPDTLVMSYTLTTFGSLAPSLLVVWIMLRCIRMRSGSTRVQSLLLTCIVVFKGLVQIVLLAMMIGALIVFFFIRDKIISAGDKSQREWSFGQVLALTTWIPVVVDFLYTLHVGMKRGLEGHLPGDYSVVQRQRDEENKGSHEGQESRARE